MSRALFAAHPHLAPQPPPRVSRAKDELGNRGNRGNRGNFALAGHFGNAGTGEFGSSYSGGSQGTGRFLGTGSHASGHSGGTEGTDGTGSSHASGYSPDAVISRDDVINTHPQVASVNPFIPAKSLDYLSEEVPGAPEGSSNLPRLHPMASLYVDKVYNRGERVGGER